MVTVCKFFLLFFNLPLFSPRGSTEKTNNKIFCFLATREEEEGKRKKILESSLLISNHIIHILKMSIAQLGSTTAVSVLYFVSRFSFFSLDSTFASL
jgi:hypothetical protein